MRKIADPREEVIGVVNVTEETPKVAAVSRNDIGCWPLGDGGWQPTEGPVSAYRDLTGHSGVGMTRNIAQKFIGAAFAGRKGDGFIFPGSNGFRTSV